MASLIVSRSRISPTSNEHDVGVLAQRRLERVGERQGVGAELALVDQRLLVLVDELDRILDRDDVRALCRVDVVDHRGERRRLARPGGPRHDDEAARQVAEAEDRGRKPELLGRPDLGGDHPEDGGDPVALLEDVAAEPGDAGDLVPEVDLLVLLEKGDLGRSHELVEELAVELGSELGVLDLLELVVDPQHGLRAGRHVEIAGALFLDDSEDVVDRCHAVAVPWELRLRAQLSRRERGGLERPPYRRRFSERDMIRAEHGSVETRGA
jgi:hypothetical protein